jgi:hypothetical protein
MRVVTLLSAMPAQPTTLEPQLQRSFRFDELQSRQNTEGVEVLTVGYTPLESNSTLAHFRFFGNFCYWCNRVHVALFNGGVDATAARSILLPTLTGGTMQFC